mgnify:FL=1
MANILEVRHLGKHFGGLQAVHDLTFNVREREILGLIGPNGAGKTTTFNLIAGFYPPDSGEVRFKGHDITFARADQICKMGICRTFQVARPFSNLTALENAMIGAFCHTANVHEAEEIAMRWLEFTDLAGRKDVLARNLTTIDQRRLELARALSTHPSLLLMDETMAGLTPAEIDVAIGLIAKVRDSGVTVIVVEHVMRAIMSVSERIIVLDGGEKIAEGTPREIAQNETVIRAYLGEGYRHARTA